MKNEDLREKLDQDIILKDTIQRIEEAFEKMVPEKDKKLLNAVKRKEIDSIRRRLISAKKQHSTDFQIPTHLNFTVLPFIAQDIGLLIKANAEHVREVNIKNCAKRHIRPLYVNLGGGIFLVWFRVWHSSAQPLIICAVFLLHLILGCIRHAHPPQ